MRTQTSPIEITSEDHVVVVPEARPQPRWGMIAAVALAVAVALLIGAVAGSVSQRGKIRARDARIASADTAALAAAAASNQARAEAASATALLNGLRSELDQKVRALALLRARGQESTTQVRDMQARVAAVQARFEQVRAEAARLTGSRLPPGRYAVRLAAVGASQPPPRLIFDVGTWLRGEAARKAAVADGFIPPGGRLPNDRYFRNRDVAWVVMPALADARVSIRSRNGRPLFESNLLGLEDILSAQRAQATELLRDPFWIVVRNGTIVSVQRQPYP